MLDGVIININLNLSAKNSGDPITDDELIKAVLGGDEQSFSLIFERYRRLSVHLVGRFFNQRETVEDIVQQSFTKIFFSLKDYRGGHEKSFSAWISRLTINVCYDELRRRQRCPEDIFSELSNDDFEFLANVVENNPANSENNLANRDLAEKLLSSLDAQERIALTLLYSEEFSVSEVAKALNWSESKVKTKLFRTRNYLRTLLHRFI